jgi:hypothetical protein
VKIINNTGSVLQYVVTPSGTTLSGSTIIASGGVSPNSAKIFSVPNAGLNPIVYVKAFQDGGNKGFLGRQTSDGNASVTITFIED